jgi:hypothetical protein
MRTSENSENAKFAEFTYHENRRCMLAFLKAARIFRGGVQVRRSATYISRPTPAP